MTKLHSFFMADYHEVPPHTGQDGHHQEIYKQQMLERLWRNGKPPTLLGGMSIDNSHNGEEYGGSLKERALPYGPATPLLGIEPEKTVIHKKTHATSCSLRHYLQ